MRLAISDLAGSHPWSVARNAGCAIRSTTWTAGWIYWIGGAWVFIGSSTRVATSLGEVSGDSIGANSGHIPGTAVNVSEDDLLGTWTSDVYAGGRLPVEPRHDPVPVPDPWKPLPVPPRHDPPPPIVYPALTMNAHAVEGSFISKDNSIYIQGELTLGGEVTRVNFKGVTVIVHAGSASSQTFLLFPRDFKIFTFQTAPIIAGSGSITVSVEIVEGIVSSSPAAITIDVPVPRDPITRTDPPNPAPPTSGSGSGGGSGGGGGGSGGGGSGGGGNGPNPPPPTGPVAYPALGLTAHAVEDCLLSTDGSFHILGELTLGSTADTHFGGRADKGVCVTVRAGSAAPQTFLLFPNDFKGFQFRCSPIIPGNGSISVSAQVAFGTVSSSPSPVPVNVPSVCAYGFVGFTDPTTKFRTATQHDQDDCAPNGDMVASFDNSKRDAAGAKIVSATQDYADRLGTYVSSGWAAGLDAAVSNTLSHIINAGCGNPDGSKVTMTLSDPI